MKSNIPIFEVDVHFMATLKSGDKEHLVMSHPEKQTILPLANMGVSSSEGDKDIILKSGGIIKKKVEVHLPSGCCKFIDIGADGKLRVTYTSTHYWPVEPAQLKSLLKGDNLPTQKAWCDYYLENYKEQLNLQDGFSGLLITWGSLYKKMHKITDFEPVNKFEKYQS